MTGIKRWAVVALSCALAAPLAQAATLYKWVDKNGNVSYQDRAPPSDSGRVEERALQTGDVANGDQKALPTVVLYSVRKCPGCDQARDYLRKRKVAFTEKNVESDVKLQSELKEKAGSLSVPTILVGDKVMRGYLESLLEDELTRVGYPKLDDDNGKDKGATPTENAAGNPATP